MSIVLECKESDATSILSSVKSVGSLGWIRHMTYVLVDNKQNLKMLT